MKNSTFITIDGDDIGQKITKYYLSNDIESLSKLNQSMIETTKDIANYLESIGFSIIFCGADGVAGHSSITQSERDIFREISYIGSKCATFSAGTGSTLRESYIALMSAKSNGKAQIYNYKDLAE
ncbi:MAG: mCpol domain-containing protein [Comamonas sp.]